MFGHLDCPFPVYALFVSSFPAYCARNGPFPMYIPFPWYGLRGCRFSVFICRCPVSLVWSTWLSIFRVYLPLPVSQVWLVPVIILSWSIYVERLSGRSYHARILGNCRRCSHVYLTTNGLLENLIQFTNKTRNGKG